MARTLARMDNAARSRGPGATAMAQKTLQGHVDQHGRCNVYAVPLSSRFLPPAFLLMDGHFPDSFFNEDYTGNHVYGNGGQNFDALSIPSNIQQPDV
jgi:hypothetical protein